MSQRQADRPTIVVVPDGLAASKESGDVLEVPSFVYRAVLDAVALRWRGEAVYLAPGNRFGARVTEQEAAASYLADKEIGNLHVPVFHQSGYVDTWGNAVLLRRFLTNRGLWPCPPITLAVGHRHKRRAVLCFRRNGFQIDEAIGVTYPIPADAAVVRRLWYYRYPVVHAIYEALAFCRDAFRSSIGLGEANRCRLWWPGASFL